MSTSGVLVASTVDEALDALSSSPSALVLAGGTDLMVELNEHRRTPPQLVVAVDRIAELSSWTHDPARGTVTIGAAVRWRDIEQGPLGELVPSLGQAARTVGSPQIRQAGTIGGNLGTCSPAGDGLPPLAALDAVIHLRSLDGRRDVPFSDYMVGPKRTARRVDELVIGVTVPVAHGWQGYAKVGVRNAMVISIASACLVHHRPSASVRVALGSVGPVVLRCPAAEEYLAASVDLSSSEHALDDTVVTRFAALVRDAARPIDDHRSTAEYRRHAVGVLAARLVRSAFHHG